MVVVVVVSRLFYVAACVRLECVSIVAGIAPAAAATTSPCSPLRIATSTTASDY